MTRKNIFLKKHPAVHLGIPAVSRDGERIGRVVEFGKKNLTVERGILFPREYTFSYDEIVGEGKNELIIDRKQPGNGTDGKQRRKDEAHVRLHEEQIEVRKVPRKKGEVSVKRVVTTEVRQLEVPVIREEIIIERKPVAGRENDSADEAFREETIRIPVMEEEIEVIKRPVQRERVDIRKERHTEIRTVSGEIRREDVEIEKDDDFGTGNA